ncbi:hypothetical protein ABVE67_004780 [Citrobacter freundii]
MEAKDQRLEIRISQQQVQEIDDIIASLDTHFRPTRSDVVRSFISQGIERHFGHGPQEENTVPLIQRLNLYFQLCQTERLKCLATNQKIMPLGNGHRHKYNNNQSVSSDITADCLVRQVYLEKLNWFFELDEQSLKSIDGQLSGGDVQILMAPQPSAEICETLADVISVRCMFRTIEAVINDAQNKVDEYGYTDVRDKLVIIRDYAASKEIPLKFMGYPDIQKWTLHAEICALLDWIDYGNAHFRVRQRIKHSGQDFTEMYACMLSVFRDMSDGGYLNLDGLVAIVKDRRL